VSGKSCEDPACSIFRSVVYDLRSVSVPQNDLVFGVTCRKFILLAKVLEYEVHAGLPKQYCEVELPPIPHKRKCTDSPSAVVR
jgi:hypothetical protein